MFASMEMVPGKTYNWYIKIKNGGNFKVGISKEITDFGHAFSDYPTGWGWYISDKQLRHNSNSTGARYGDSVVTGDVVGFTFDTVQGTLSYSKNGTDLGVAYTEECFKSDIFYPAFSCLSTNESAELVNMDGSSFPR